MIKLNWTKCGQMHAYGDTYRICEIITNEELEESKILELIRNGKKLRKDIFDSTKKTMIQYFTGYYTIEKTIYGYLYTGVEPYDD